MELNLVSPQCCGFASACVETPWLLHSCAVPLVVNLFALVHPRSAPAFLHAAYAGGAACAAGCPWPPNSIVVPPALLAARGYLLFLGTLLYQKYRALIQGFLSLLPFSPPLEALLFTATHAKNKKNEGGPAWAYCPARLRSSFFSSPLLYLSTLPHGLSSFTSVSPQLLPILSLLHVLACAGLFAAATLYES